MRTRSLADYCIVLFAESSGIDRALKTAKFLGTFVDYPPSQKPANSSIDISGQWLTRESKKQKRIQNSDKYIGSFFDWRSNIGSTQ